MSLATNMTICASTTADRHVRILMADDDRDDHLLVLMAAEEAGLVAEFTFVDDGANLMFHLARLDSTDDLPDLIILDLRMPGLDGHRTLDELQSHPVLWQIPVVVFSSSTRRSDEHRSLKGGARWFETKPSTFSGLVDFVSSLPSRATPVAYGDDSAGERMAVLSADVIAEIEDDLLRNSRDLDWD